MPGAPFDAADHFPVLAPIFKTIKSDNIRKKIRITKEDKNNTRR